MIRETFTQSSEVGFFSESTQLAELAEKINGHLADFSEMGLPGADARKPLCGMDAILDRLEKIVSGWEGSPPQSTIFAILKALQNLRESLTFDSAFELSQAAAAQLDQHFKRATISCVNALDLPYVAMQQISHFLDDDSLFIFLNQHKLGSKLVENDQFFQVRLLALKLASGFDLPRTADDFLACLRLFDATSVKSSGLRAIALEALARRASECRGSDWKLILLVADAIADLAPQDSTAPLRALLEHARGPIEGAREAWGRLLQIVVSTFGESSGSSRSNTQQKLRTRSGPQGFNVSGYSRYPDDLLCLWLQNREPFDSAVISTDSLERLRTGAIRRSQCDFVFEAEESVASWKLRAIEAALARSDEVLAHVLAEFAWSLAIPQGLKDCAIPSGFLFMEGLELQAAADKKLEHAHGTASQFVVWKAVLTAMSRLPANRQMRVLRRLCESLHALRPDDLREAVESLFPIVLTMPAERGWALRRLALYSEAHGNSWGADFYRSALDALFQILIDRDGVERDVWIDNILEMADGAAFMAGSMTLGRVIGFLEQLGVEGEASAARCLSKWGFKLLKEGKGDLVGAFNMTLSLIGALQERQDRIEAGRNLVGWYARMRGHYEDEGLVELYVQAMLGSILDWDDKVAAAEVVRAMMETASDALSASDKVILKAYEVAADVIASKHT